MPVFGFAVEVPPEPSSNIVAHWEAADAVLSGSTVLSLADKTANNNDLTATGDPQYNATGLNGLPTIAFDGGLDALIGGTLTNLPENNADRTMFCIMKFTSGNYGGFGYGDSGPDLQFTLGQYPSNEYSFLAGNGPGDTDNDIQTGVFGTDWVLFNVVHTATGGALGTGHTDVYLNNVKIGQYDHVMFTLPIQMAIGKQVVEDFYRTIEFAEGIIYDAALAGGDLAAAQQFYIDKYILTEPAIYPVINSGSTSIAAANMDVNSTPIDFVAPTITATNSTGGLLTWSLDTQAANGTAVCSGVGSSPPVLDYDPATDWDGDDSFVIKVTNDDGLTDVITVTIKVLPANDTTPAQFTFGDLSGVAISTEYASNIITVQDTNAPAVVTITAGTFEYSKNGGARTALDGTADSGDTIQLFMTSSAAYSSNKNGTLSIGGVTDTWTLTTVATPGLGTIADIDFEGTEAEINAAAAPWSIEDTVNCGISTAHANGGTRSMVGTYGPDADIAGQNDDSWVEFNWEMGGLSESYPELWFAFDLYIDTNFIHRNPLSGSDNNKLMFTWGGPRVGYTDSTLRTGAFLYCQILRDANGDSDFHASYSGREWLTTNVTNPVDDVDWVRHTGTYYSPPGKFNSGLRATTAYDGISDRGQWMRLTFHLKQATIANNDGIYEMWKQDYLGNIYKCFDIQDGPWYATMPGQPGVDAAGFNIGYLLGWSNSGYTEATDFAIDNLIFTTDDITPT